MESVVYRRDTQVSNNLLLLSDVDSILYEWEDSIYTFKPPTKFLYSDDYLVSFHENSIVLYYKIDEETGYRDDFYYWNMIQSGKQDSIIKANFGDSSEIIKVLK